MTKPKLKVVDGAGAPPGEDRWQSLLTRTKDGNVEGTLHNLCLILERDANFDGLFWLNESSNQVVLSRSPPWTSGNVHEFTDQDGCELAAWLQDPAHYAMRCGADLALAGVITVARRHRLHPIREYLQSREWDGTPRIERMFVDLFGAADNRYSHQAARCFMVGAVARMLWVDPKVPSVGAKVDFMLVLEGAQGKKKTTSVSTLFGAQWYAETLESPSGKDFYQALLGCWCVEIAEMDSFTKADTTAVKVAITRRSDKYRAPYERVPKTFRRECIFVGTTNETEWLRDATGGRRFLPLKILDDGEIKIAGIEAQRDQLWAEAVQLFAQGVEWWKLPEDAVEEQELRFFEDSWADRIARWLEGRAPGDNAYPGRILRSEPIRWTTTDELLQYAIGMDAGRHGRQEQMRISNIMKRAGWIHKRSTWDGSKERSRRWIRVSDDPRGPGGGDAPF